VPGVNVANDLIYKTKSDIYKSEVVQDAQHLKMLYEAEIYDLDSQIKLFLDYLDKEGLLKDTIIIFTSDHGEEFMEHGSLGHVTKLYNEDIKIPLIIFAPKLERKRIDNIVQSIDIFPTVFGMLGINDPDFREQMQGINMLTNKNEYVFSEYSGSEKQMVTDGRYKLIENSIGGGMKTYEFYDLTTDPDEKTNIWENGKNLYDPFIKQLSKHNLDSKKYYQPPNDFPESINDEQRKELIQKGYF
jgi:arylsulfatase A-like enzyme